MKIKNLYRILFVICALSFGIFAQNTEPKPSAPKSVKIPAVKQTKLKNGLTVAVVERKNVPLVTVRLLINAGSETEGFENAGLADMTASLITKGTKRKTANQISEELEFLGASLFNGANWNSSYISVNMMSDKVDPVLAILSDSVLNPVFKQEEIDLLKSQTLDSLSYNLTQPGFLANYVASAYTFGEHPTGGTPESINGITRDKIVEFHKEGYYPENAVLLFTGNISSLNANALARKYFSVWKNNTSRKEIIQQIDEAPTVPPTGMTSPEEKKEVGQILVIDLPNSGQAAVSYAKVLGRGRIDIKDDGKIVSDSLFYPASVLNSLLGGGYSSRLNQEIRIKRGLSYGAGSGFTWRDFSSNFTTRTQTKNESAAEVAELVIAEINKLSTGEIPESELNPRKLVLTGSFGRNLETNQGLAVDISTLYSYGLTPDLLNSHMNNVMSVNDKQIKQFASENFKNGDIIIVGDYSVFKDDLTKRFPNINVEVIKADELDITQENLRKAN